MSSHHKFAIIILLAISAVGGCDVATTPPETREQRITRRLHELEERLKAIREKYTNDHEALQADVERAVANIRNNEKDSTRVRTEVKELRRRVDDLSKNLEQYIIDLKALRAEGGSEQ